MEAPSAQTRKDDTSRPGALSRFFRMSRDGWKSKYKDLKATVKGYKNRLAHLTRSREQLWVDMAQQPVQPSALELRGDQFLFTGHGTRQFSEAGARRIRSYSSCRPSRFAARRNGSMWSW